MTMTVLLNKKEAASWLKCSVSKIEKMMHAGELEYVKIGSLVRFTATALEQYLAGTTRSPGHVPARKDTGTVVENTRTYGPVGRRQ